VCFYILGEKASPAVPELVRLMFLTNSPYIAQSAEWALTCVSNEAIRILITILDNPTQPSRKTAVRFLGKYADRFERSAAPAVPSLIGCMHETNRDLAHEAATTLGKLQLEPLLAVPALLGGLHHEDSGVRVASATALGRFDENARGAVPALLKAARADPDTSVREAAEMAVRMIAPEIFSTNRVDHFE
jgi:HEAT repeat protein